MKYDNEYYYKSKPKNNAPAFIVIFILSVIIGSFIYIDTTLKPSIKVLAETKAAEIANRSINNTVAKIIKGKVNYKDLINVQYDKEGKIRMIQANTVLMNELSSSIAIGIQDELLKSKVSDGYLPIGLILKSPLLSKYGPKLPVSVEPFGTISVNFRTKFESAGINQTRHRIYLESRTKVKILVPLSTSTKEIETQIPICDSVIVGDVPNSYVNIPENGVKHIIPNINSNLGGKTK